jgi:hypothetical protein
MELILLFIMATNWISPGKKSNSLTLSQVARMIDTVYKRLNKTYVDCLYFGLQINCAFNISFHPFTTKSTFLNEFCMETKFQAWETEISNNLYAYSVRTANIKFYSFTHENCSLTLTERTKATSSLHYLCAAV